jgi:hypothetical protein
MEFLLVLAMYPWRVSLILTSPLRECLISHWEWRDDESSVYPRGQGPDWRSTVLSGGDGHVLVLGYSDKSWYMQDSVLHMSCG